jgi:hypothetical protein
VRQAIFSLHDGDMHERKYGVFSECTLDQLVIGDAGLLEIVISPTEHAGNWMRSHPDARILTIRQYQSDWERDAVASFSIECSCHRGMPAQRAGGVVTAAAIERAAAWIEASMSYWRQYTERSRTSLPQNAFTAPSTPRAGRRRSATAQGSSHLAPTRRC